MGIINIDGVKTRQNIAEETGRAFGIKQLCDELGVSANLVSKYCRQGYGDGAIIIDLIRKGIPFEVSREPVPCRVKKVHTRGKGNITADITLRADILEASEDLKKAEQEKANWHLLNALKTQCQSIIEQIEDIQQDAMYESIFGGKDNE